MDFNIGDRVRINTPKENRHGHEGIVCEMRPGLDLSVGVLFAGSLTNWYKPEELELLSPAPAPDAVNGPAHYGGADNPYEAIKVIEAWKLGFALGNAVKYIARAGKKGDALEDLAKAEWYIRREIQRRQTKQTPATDVTAGAGAANGGRVAQEGTGAKPGPENGVRGGGE